MWKSLSIKAQLILILLIPILGFIYMAVMNIVYSYENFQKFNDGLENINNIAKLSRGISEISYERGFYNYSYYDPSQKARFGLEKQKTIDWFLNTRINDTVITKNLKSIEVSLLKLQSDIETGVENPLTAHVKYTRFNRVLNNLIQREITNIPTARLTKLALNYYNYIILKEGSLLRRGTLLQKIVDAQNNRKFDNAVIELYYKAKSNEEVVDFNLKNSKFADINSELIKYSNSKKVEEFYKNSEEIIQDKLKMSPILWWNESSEIAEKFTALEKKNLGFIVEYANTEKEAALRSIIVTISVLFLFLLLSSILTYRLIHKLSGTLGLITSSIRKISLGEIIENQNFSGGTEFIKISNSFNELLTAKREQIDLALKIKDKKYGSTINIRSDKDILNNSLNNMSLELFTLNKVSEEISLQEKNIIEINKSIVESKDLSEFGTNICETVVKQTDSCQANFYIFNTEDSQDGLHLIGGYANDKNTPETIALGEGLVGEAAKTNQQKCLNNLSENYSYVSSSLGKSPYYNVLITPVTYKEEVIGVIEIGSLKNFGENHKKLLSTVSNSIGSAIEILIRNEELKKSFTEINYKNNVLQAQEEELRQSNEELNRQTLLLQQSEEELKNQAAELEQTNAYLEDQRYQLEQKNYEVGLKNDELILAQEELSNKAEEIEQASKYKSEFLANMSHELRTPLNSILILSDLLKENSAGNLSQSQIDNLSVINNSGNDLLNLITDILDISKIESGKADVHLEESTVESLSADMQAVFNAQMHKKKIDFTTVISDDCPQNLNTDIGKLEQIAKNFLSNALKFTPENGKVSLRFSSGEGKSDFKSLSLAKLNSNEILSIHVEDNGIGISEENKSKLFQSFQQADSSTSRKYGGTGLGLFISKELASILGGEVDFESELNKGSVFSVYVPATFNADEFKKIASLNDSKREIAKKSVEKNYQPKSETPTPSPKTTLDLTQNFDDDRDEVTQSDKTILIIEDDPNFAEILKNVAHDNGFKAIIATQGEMGFQYAKQYKPKAITLDLKLPGIDGWTVLKWLKEDQELKHIPVHVMSGMDREKLVKEMGAFDFQIKPLTAERLKDTFSSIDHQINKVYKKVLILEDDVNLNYSIKELVQDTDKNVICIQAHTFAEAESILKNDDIDCAIMDIGLHDSEDVKNISSLKKISKNKEINIIVNTGKPLSEAEVLHLKDSADGIVIKTENVTSRLKDELTLFLDKIKTSKNKEYSPNQDVLGGEILKGKNILVVDDDIRNIYALSSALSTKGASIVTAFNGKEALEALESNPNIDIVLMDIMMPEMDGFEATRKIRENSKWKNLPIIALTAKAMKGDREEILNAGASDYQTKPIDIVQLISLISIWVYN